MIDDQHPPTMTTPTSDARPVKSDVADILDEMRWVDASTLIQRRDQGDWIAGMVVQDRGESQSFLLSSKTLVEIVRKYDARPAAAPTPEMIDDLIDAAIILGRYQVYGETVNESVTERQMDTANGNVRVAHTALTAALAALAQREAQIGRLQESVRRYNGTSEANEWMDGPEDNLIPNDLDPIPPTDTDADLRSGPPNQLG